MDDKARRRWEQDMYWRQQEAAWRNEEVRRCVSTLHNILELVLVYFASWGVDG
jgi:hypothetical protein